MIKFIENILALLKNATAANESSLIYYDGYSLVRIASSGVSRVIPEVLIATNELLHIIKDDNPGSLIQQTLQNEIYANKAYIHHYQQIETSLNNRCFYILISTGGRDKNIEISNHLISYFNEQIKSIGSLVDNFHNSDYSVLSSLKLIEMGNWKEILNQLNEISGDIVFIIDHQGNFLSINDSGARLLDYIPDEINGKHFTEFIDQDNINYSNAEISKIIESRGTGKFDITFVTKFEKKLHIELNIKAVVSEDRIIGMLGVGRNITLLKQLEAKLNELEPRLIEAERLIKVEKARSNQHKALLDELNRMKNEFVSSISHELRTPLASIVGFSETINSDPKMPDDLRLEFNSIILNEGKRLAKLINDVLDLSRIEAGTITLNKTEFNIIELIDSLCNEYKKVAEAKSQHFIKEILSEPIYIFADKDRISQAIQAVLNNAIKFNKPNGRISVFISNLYREVEIIITDTGIGIPEKDLPFIFQKFHRVSRSEADNSGTGIGLVFVKQIVDLHRGLVTVQSEHNRGTTFIIKLLKSNKERK